MGWLLFFVVLGFLFLALYEGIIKALIIAMFVGGGIYLIISILDYSGSKTNVSRKDESIEDRLERQKIESEKSNRDASNFALFFCFLIAILIGLYQESKKGTW